MSLLLLFSGAPAVVVPPPVAAVPPTIIYSRGTASPGMSEVLLCNLALSHLGHSIAITSLTEPSAPARACNQWYTLCRDELLQSFAWPFAITTADLALVAATPNGPEWAYTYRAPADALLLLRAPYGSVRNPTRTTLTRYRIERNPLGGGLLYMDQPYATIEYIARVTDPEEYSPDFVVALSYLLASRICARVVSENASQRALTMLAMYKETRSTAMMRAANESVSDPQPESDLMTARN